MKVLGIHSPHTHTHTRLITRDQCLLDINTGIKHKQVKNYLKRHSIIVLCSVRVLPVWSGIHVLTKKHYKV